MKTKEQGADRDTNKEETMMEDSLFLRFGVSLAHLACLPIEPNETFHAAATFVKEKTVTLNGYRSYARYLLGQPKTRHLVKPQADVFVSYAWGGGFGATMDALKEHFKNDLEQTYVWMDFAIVDQHEAATKEIDFHQWAKTFRGNLQQTGCAVLVLAPGEKPLATTRSWCCFEWVTIVNAQIPFQYCVPPDNESHLVERMQDGISLGDVFTIFAGINVEQAQAFKKSDQDAILQLMREIGVVKVNDVVMKSLKQWLIEIAKKAEQRSPEASLAMTYAISARGTLHQALGELDDALLWNEKAVPYAKKSNQTEDVIASLINNLAVLRREKGDLDAAESLYEESPCGKGARGDPKDAEPLYRESLANRRKVFADDDPRIAMAMNNLGSLLDSLGDSEGAEPLYRGALAIWRKSLGDNHPNVAAVLNNIGELLRAKGDFESAEPLLRESLTIRMKTMGDEHPKVALGLHNLALLLKDTGREAEARVLGKQAYGIALKVFGTEHPDTTMEYMNWVD